MSLYRPFPCIPKLHLNCSRATTVQKAKLWNMHGRKVNYGMCKHKDYTEDIIGIHIELIFCIILQALRDERFLIWPMSLLSTKYNWNLPSSLFIILRIERQTNQDTRVKISDIIVTYKKRRKKKPIGIWFLYLEGFRGFPQLFNNCRQGFWVDALFTQSHTDGQRLHVQASVQQSGDLQQHCYRKKVTRKFTSDIHF